ncbi:unnamed protein product [Lactuca virosa]|uniref:Uncharacterized protein n=1 Tax=Lactuca virosa TaxID=75947 RepID=A0AAU9P9S0_9ASTR|nr:unnamed protein product [Lactuca virosa]
MTTSTLSRLQITISSSDFSPCNAHTVITVIGHFVSFKSNNCLPVNLVRVNTGYLLPPSIPRYIYAVYY